MRYTGTVYRERQFPPASLDCVKPEPLLMSWLRKDAGCPELHISSHSSESCVSLPRQVVAFSIPSQAASSVECCFLSQKDTRVLEGGIYLPPRTIFKDVEK